MAEPTQPEPDDRPASIRLLSPTRRRIWAGNVSRTSDVLARCGWERYDGPATTDNRGWVHPGSDPALVENPKAHDHYRHRG